MDETKRYFAGLEEIQWAGWGRLNARVMKVASELVEYSGQVFRIVPGQTFQWGQAHAGGWIILDISVAAGASDSVLAFKLAHEWGHESLGHQPNIYNPYGSGWKLRMSPTQDEDEADVYAGKFLAAAGYPVEPVVNYLRSLPTSPPGDSHSDGPKRARLVKKGYDSVKGSRAEETEERKPVCRTVRSQCQHPAHPQGDVSACVHAAHPFDLGPCGHVCMLNPYAYSPGPCHPQGDSFPCSHPAHYPGDVFPCTHAAHPRGDEQRVCD